ncbi:hypothetical protein CNR22_00730 [Sphingobacteriaceae bacterium]|nr:hypothetical protein CNR22_00730 [Sphingobacteriaceae bacterium]
MKTILFLLALTFNIFLCLYPGNRLPATKGSDSATERIQIIETVAEQPQRQTMTYSAMLKNKASELSQK